MKKCPKNHENPDEAKFCRICGLPIGQKDVNIISIRADEEEKANSNVDNRPFCVRFPEYHLKPLSEYKELSFVFDEPEYVEDPSKAENNEFLWIVRKEKFGILYWHRRPYWYDDYERIIKCKYDKIIKHKGMFECHDGKNIIFLDIKGNVLK